MKDFRSLIVWRKAHELTLQIYSQTRGFPKEETYGLTSQIRRSAYSIPTNIAEGCGKGSNTDFGRFLQIAFGSACELEYQLFFSRDLDLFTSEQHSTLDERVIEIKKMLASLIGKTRQG
jgi:four helix bundle protein